MEGLRSGVVVVAGNGSTDGSTEIASAEGAIVETSEQRAMAMPLKEGILESRGKYVLMADSDDSYELWHIPRFLDELQLGR